MQIYNRTEQKDLRRDLRKNLTEPELRLWARLRGKQLGVKFRRQQGIGRYIVDFYCAEAKLVIELDGDSHYQEGAQEYDRIRDEYMQACGLLVLRFLNPEIIENIDAVLIAILQAIEKGKNKQNP